MSAPPPPPPRPPQQQQQQSSSVNLALSNASPPVPPPPPGFRPEIDGRYNTQPHVVDPLVAPKPQKLMSSVPAEMARSLESQMPATPAPAPYGQPVPSISFGIPQMPGTYPSTPQPPSAMYQGQYSQSFNQGPYRGATPLPYPGTPQPYQSQQQQPLASTGLPPVGPRFGPPRLGPSPAPPPNAGLSPNFTPSARPMSWGGTPTPSPGPPPHMPAARPTSVYGMTPPSNTPGPGLQAVGQVGIQAPPPNPHWVNGATPPTSRPTSAVPSINRYNIDNTIAGLTFTDPSPKSSSVAPTQLTVQLPTAQTLSQSMNPVLQGRDPTSKVMWCKDVLNALERAIQAAGANIGEGSAKDLLKPAGGVSQAQVEQDAQMLRLGDAAVACLIGLLHPPLPIGQSGVMPSWLAEALFLRGQVIATGIFPERLPKSPRDAFRDFEASARGGYAPAWFKLGRDYETVGDIPRAKDCFDRGIQRGVGSCFYRMGMAHLQGQLGLPQDPNQAMPLLRQAAYLSSIEVPQPAYVYALLLLNEFPHITLPESLLQTLVPASHPYPTQPNVPPPSLLSESRKYLERSAYLGFGPAMYKLGQSYEHALPPFPYDPLMSVQYYSLASQQGNALADLALSKWFLVGSNPSPNDPNASQTEGFDKDESLALVFAEKAASKGEPGGEFAVGYYCEVGIGRPADLREAKGWYERAAKQGHEDAISRLKELRRENPTPLGVQEATGRLERMRTSAMQRGKANASQHLAAPPIPEESGDANRLGPMSGASVVAMARTSSRIHHGGRYRKKAEVEEFSNAPAAGSSTQAPEGPPKIAPKPAAPGTTTGTSGKVSMTTTTSSITSSATTEGAKKPATFEEMGYHSHKLEDEKCIIM